MGKPRRRPTAGQITAWRQIFGAIAFTVGTTSTTQWAHSAQFGPVFPSHRFPTDESYHLGYGLVYGSSSANFLGSRTTEPLVDESRFRLLRQQLTFEYQPSRRFAAGAVLSFDSMRLSSVVTEESVNKSQLADQRVYFEYRFNDGPGHSLGVAVQLKFPFYSNPTLAKLPEDGGSIVLMGDAQTDLTAFLTGEYWPTDVLRFRADFGYTYRTEAFAAEMPFMTSVGVVTPRMDFELKFLGNFTLGNDGFDDSNTDIGAVRVRFANSDYAYSPSPWMVAIEPEFTYWLGRKWGVQTNLRYALLGNKSPNFYTAMLGITYRWSKTDKRVRRTLRDVDLDVDQESGLFPGERLEE